MEAGSPEAHGCKDPGQGLRVYSGLDLCHELITLTFSCDIGRVECTGA